MTVHYATDQSEYAIEHAVEGAKRVTFNAKGVGSSPWWSILSSLLPFVLLFGFWIFLMNQVQGGGSKVMSFGKSRAKRMTPDAPKIGFKDVAGVDEAVEELQEIKEFLENPKKFQALGARIPKGVLLYGPPGTGKTLLARAVAGEAGVPFFSISGSDFVEMFVGVGASRVRDLFEQAKQATPCIIFMDEIDAVGRHRGAGLGGGHDEREQTLNQLLVEMDGFEMKDNIILIAATNRPDILDPALLRPGRFDRQIVVDRPDRVGRRKILEVHTKGKPLAPEIDLDTLASGTPGFTGADLSNLVNEAALLAARRGKKIIEQEELEEGIMRVVAGPEKKARLLSEHERKITAYHEMGHALVGHYLEHTDPVHKITIVSRGQALGLTISLPTEDKYLTTRSALMHQMAMTLGGRAAEEIVFHEVTTGAANDLEKITSMAKQMIMRFGMSEKLGPRVLGRGHDQPFLGRDYGAEADYSEEIAREIDDEIRRVIEEAHELALAVLREHMDELHKISAILIERETIDKDQFERLLAGEDEGTVFPDEAPASRRQPEPQTGAQARAPAPASVPAAGLGDAGPGSREQLAVVDKRRDPKRGSRTRPTTSSFPLRSRAASPCSAARAARRRSSPTRSTSCRRAGRRPRTARLRCPACTATRAAASQARARSSAARSVGSPCAGSTSSTGRSSSGRSRSATSCFGHVLAAAELDAQPVAEVRERVARDDRVDRRQPEDEVVVLASGVGGDAERPRARAVEMPLALTRTEPGEILALHAAHALGVDAELLDPVLPGVGGRRVDGEAEPAGVALVVGRGEDDGGRALAQLVGNGERVEQHEVVAELDRVRGDELGPPLLLAPVGMRRLPVPDPGTHLTHGAILFVA